MSLILGFMDVTEKENDTGSLGHTGTWNIGTKLKDNVRVSETESV